jgi:hypothetical protein
VKTGSVLVHWSLHSSAAALHLRSSSGQKKAFSYLSNSGRITTRSFDRNFDSSQCSGGSDESIS